MGHLLRSPLFLAVVTCLGTACWIVCFWLMVRISRRQDALLKELHRQTRGIATLTKEEHHLIQEVHPQVGAIKEAIEHETPKETAEEPPERAKA